MSTWLKKQVSQAFSKVFLGAGDAFYIASHLREMDAQPNDLNVLAWMANCEPYIKAMIAKLVWVDPVAFDVSIKTARSILDTLTRFNSSLKDQVYLALNDPAEQLITLRDDDVSVLAGVRKCPARLRARIADRLGVDAHDFEVVLTVAAMIEWRSWGRLRKRKIKHAKPVAAVVTA